MKNDNQIVLFILFLATMAFLAVIYAPEMKKAQNDIQTFKMMENFKEIK